MKTISLYCSHCDEERHFSLKTRRGSIYFKCSACKEHKEPAELTTPTEFKAEMYDDLVRLLCQNNQRKQNSQKPQEGKMADNKTVAAFKDLGSDIISEVTAGASEGASHSLRDEMIRVFETRIGNKREMIPTPIWDAVKGPLISIIFLAAALTFGDKLRFADLAASVAKKALRVDGMFWGKQAFAWCQGLFADFARVAQEQGYSNETVINTDES